MEVVKTNCQYSITDKSENGWNTSGSLTKETSGNTNVTISVNDELGTYIGNYSYNIDGGNMLHINMSVHPEHKAEFISHSEKIVADAITLVKE